MDTGIAGTAIPARQVALLAVGLDKTLVGLAQDEVAAMDQSLAGRWAIDIHEDVDDIWPLLGGVQDTAALETFRDLHDEVVTGERVEDEEFYDAMSHPEIVGPVTSKRRHLILDLAALSIGLYRQLGLTGGVLDAGCHVGAMSSLVAEALGCAVMGIDFSEIAIAEGTQHAARHPLVTLEREIMPWKTVRRFDMVISGSAMPSSADTALGFLKSLGALLRPGGIAVVMSSAWVDADVERVRRHLRVARLGFGYTDVAGGYGNIPLHFEAEGLVVLIKGGTAEFPRRVQALMESEWNQFRDYANMPGTCAREKTQAFERARRAASRSALPEALAEAVPAV